MTCVDPFVSNSTCDLMEVCKRNIIICVTTIWEFKLSRNSVITLRLNLFRDHPENQKSSYLANVRKRWSVASLCLESSKLWPACSRYLHKIIYVCRFVQCLMWLFVLMGLLIKKKKKKNKQTAESVDQLQSNRQQTASRGSDVFFFWECFVWIWAHYAN